MKDKEKLKKLVQIIGDLIKVEGNEWLIDEVLNSISKASPVEEIVKHSLIQNIHEFCVEQKIAKQAEEFYASFPIDDIRAQLIEDYKKMEHERRRDDFDGFGLCMFQQFEAINNFLFKNHIQPDWKRIKNVEVSKYKDKKTGDQVVNTLTDEALGKSTTWGVFPKFKVVLFYFYFNEKVPLPYSYSKMKEVFYELYQIRNKNHREGDLFDFQEGILKKIEGNESKYYFKFYGFLQDFVGQIEKTLLNVREKGNQITSSNEDSLGADNPILSQLRDQFR